MTDAQHQELLTALVKSKGMVILCGYQHPIYDDVLSDWNRVTRDVRAAGQSGSVMRTEVLWINKAANNSNDLFGGRLQ